MMSPVAAPWRLAICDAAGWILGTGFLITPRFALTCAHVLPENPGHLWVQCGGTGTGPTRAHLSSLAETRSADVALLELDEPLEDITPAAPGPVEPPSAGALLEVFGLPRKGRVREAVSHGHRPDGGRATETPGAGVETGIWVPVRVDGQDLAGQRIQLTSRSPHPVPFQHGFSGGPVIEPQSDLVVGMLSHKQPAQPMSLMIPIRTLAASSPVLRAILLPPTLADREFSAGLAALGSGNYPAALGAFRVVCARHPENADIWYYVALAALRGQRPRAHASGYITEISGLVEQAASLSPAGPHVRALWAVIKEDHYRARGRSEGIPTVEELRREVPLVSPGHATEICRHVPAPETRIWQELDHRRNP